jgi:hypothetical protein
MDAFLSILLIIVLLFIVYFDFRYMAVPMYVLILALLISVARLIFKTNLNTALSIAGINLMGCSIIILMSFLILFILRSSVFNPINSVLGAGDIVFLPVICSSLSPFNFIVFFIISLVVILGLKSLIYRSGKVFPLAGGLSFLLILTLISARIAAVNLFDDGFLIHLIYY